MTQRGILKHSGDVVKQGFRILDADGLEHPLNPEFQEWMRQRKFIPKLRDAIISAHITGDGLLEREWIDTDGGSVASTSPPPEGAALNDIHVIDAAYCRFTPFTDESGAVGFMLVQRVPSGDVVKLHPKRYHHIKLKSMPGLVHGLSSIEAGYHAALSKVKGDQGIGEILFHSGTPKLHGGIDNASPDEIEAVFEMMNDPDFTRGFVWDSRLKVSQLNPQGIDVQPFYQMLKVSIAAAIGLPVMLLEGAQAGAVTGSETNLDDYHSDLKQIHANILNPVIEDVFRSWSGDESFSIAWNDFPQSRREEAEGIEKRVTAWTLLMGQGVKPAAAARICGLDLDEDDIEAPRPPPNLIEEPPEGSEMSEEGEPQDDERAA